MLLAYGDAAMLGAHVLLQPPPGHAQQPFKGRALLHRGQAQVNNEV
jgi:hypothetical protein